MLQGPKYLVLKPILTEKPGSGGNHLFNGSSDMQVVIRLGFLSQIQQNYDVHTKDAIDTNDEKSYKSVDIWR